MAKRNQKRGGSFAGIVGILLLMALVYILVSMVVGAVSLVWKILAFVAPILFIITMFMDMNTIKDFIGMLSNKIKTDTPRGLIYAAGSVIGYPFVAMYLFLKAMNKRKDKKTHQKKAKNKKVGEDYVDFEDIADDDFLELPDLEEENLPEKKPLNRYDDLFSD